MFPPKASNVTHKITLALHTDILLELCFSVRNFVGQQDVWDISIFTLHTLELHAQNVLGELIFAKITTKNSQELHKHMFEIQLTIVFVTKKLL